ncbi:PEGA domain-containing protein [Bdellovibrionota bacterium FG-2]
MKLSLIFCAALIVSLSTTLVSASDRPEWTQKRPKDTADSKFYVGRSSEAPNEQQGFSSAVSDAIDQARLENFGAIVTGDHDSYESLTKTESIKRTQEHLRSVRLNGFERDGEYIEERPDGRINTWVLFKYGKADITQEKARLASEKNETKAVIFSQQGDPTEGVKGTVKISSLPNGASVLIDGRGWGLTPVQVNGQLSPGLHTLSLSHPSFEEVDEQFIVTPGKTVKLEKVLMKASGSLRVASEPPGAVVLVDGKPEGPTPTHEIKVEAGTKVRVELLHPEAERFSQEVEVGKHDTKNLNINLPLKPSHLALITTPPGTSVRVDGRAILNSGRSPVITPIAELAIEAGNHDISFEKDGYRPETINVSLRGGERRTIASIKLITVSEVEEKQTKAVEAARIEQLRSESSPWILSGYLGGAWPTVNTGPAASSESFGLSIEKWFGRFGLHLESGVNSSGSTDTVKFIGRNSNNNSFIADTAKDTAFPYEGSGYELGFGIPVAFARGTSRIDGTEKSLKYLCFVSPEAGLFRQRLVGLPVAGKDTREAQFYLDHGIYPDSIANAADITLSQQWVGLKLGADFSLERSPIGLLIQMNARRYSGGGLTAISLGGSGGILWRF